MPLQKYTDLLKRNFRSDIYNDKILNVHELYVEVNPEKVLNICKFVYYTSTLVSMFASDERQLAGKFAIYYVFAIKEENDFVILKTMISEDNPNFYSITRDIPAAHLYELEIKDMFGLIPVGHPDSRRFVSHENWPQNTYPLRKDFDRSKKLPFEHHPKEFTHVHGTGVYEIPVGPVHAGIIEPGHFRFSVAGEPIINLEAQLFYVHKGIEKMCEGMSIEKCFYVSERISGDESFTNSLAYCLAIEKIAGIQLPEKASYSRVLFAELERLVSHLGDLAGICVDVAYGFAGLPVQDAPWTGPTRLLRRYAAAGL